MAPSAVLERLRKLEAKGIIRDYVALIDPHVVDRSMLAFVAETARAAGLDDYRVLVNVGPGGGQTIFHLHWHVLGGKITGLMPQ